MKEVKNVFIGIDLPSHVQLEFEKVLTELSSIDVNVKKSLPHVTLYFLGNISGESISKVQQIYSKLDFPEITVNLKGFGTFDKPQSKILYINVEKTNKVQKTHEIAKEAYINFIKPEKGEFVPHLTVSSNLKKENYIEKQDEIKHILEKVDWSFTSSEIKLYGRFEPYKAITPIE